MARKRSWRVHGPYREEHHGTIRWRIVIVAPSGDRESVFAETEAEATEAAELAKVQILGELTFNEAISRYKQALAEKQNKERSIKTTVFRLRHLLPLESPLSSFNDKRARQLDDARCAKVSADTQLNELVELKAFFKWCVKRRWFETSPFEDVEPQGKRSRGKPQFHRHEALQFSEAAFATYRARHRGWEAGLGLLLALWLGLRSWEICCLRVRDVDPSPEGMWLWVAEEDGKTYAAKRRVEVPAELAELLEHQAGHARKKGASWLFPAKNDTGHRGHTWLRKAAKRIADEAGLDVYVPPHGLRGTQSTLATEAGVSGYLVAQQLGHANEKVTERSYIAPGVKQRVQDRRVFKVLAGGKG
jgi:integrase